ncbi:MAG TPA: DUF433 domain-containing protein [Acetobacteraceae bacterium]|nr:DUF433 domain-containing protein [Acetobacteraceae bacterium]
MPGRMSGAPVVRGTRVAVQAVIDNADDGYTAEQIAAEIYHGLPVEPTRRVIEFARRLALRRLLLDQSAPWGLRQVLTRFNVKAAYDLGWDRIANGRLLTVAEEAGSNPFARSSQFPQTPVFYWGMAVLVPTLGTSLFPLRPRPLPAANAGPRPARRSALSHFAIAASAIFRVLGT